MATDPRELAIREEQTHVDRAYARLEMLRERAEQRRREALGATVVTHADLVNRDAMAYRAADRVRALSLGDEEPLVFGRVDLDTEEIFHVGRVSVLGEDLEPLVVDWRSDVAAPFYRATPADPQGLTRRRVIHCRGRQVLAVDDHLLDLEGGEPDEGLVGDAAMMAALTRDRSDHMRDIVATIQAEQDRVIRLPATGVVVVTGGPGTGKTAVALHRVAYLLYRDRERLERRGVLVVGPSRAFAEYIRGVLPSLGETSAVLRSLGSFVRGIDATRHDRREVARIKGDARMATVLKRFVECLRAGTAPRDAFARLRRDETALRRAADGVLRARDIDLLAGSWTTDHDEDREPSVEDVALVDELRTLLQGRPPERRTDDPRTRRQEDPAEVQEVSTFAERDLRVDLAEAMADPGYDEFGHIVVDEAQDLSAMQWRMLARRGAWATWTVVGDLAQRETLAAPDTWREVIDLLGRSSVEITDLSVNYRTPGPIMALAGRLLPRVAPGQNPPRSARTDGDPPEVVVTEDLLDTVDVLARRRRAERTGTLAVIADDLVVPVLASRLLDVDMRVLDPWTAKGLEFDAVIVAAPARIAADHGWAAVYVALTRATRHLTVVAEGELPEPLRP